MKKKARIALFMLAATVFNILLTVLFLAILMLLFTVLLVPHIPEEAGFIGIPLLFLASFILSFVIYQKVLKFFLKKYPLKEN